MESASTPLPPLPPGPQKWDPKLGNLEDIAKEGGLKRYFEHVHDKYGSIVSFRLKEGEVVVSIADPQLLKESGAVRLGSRPKHLFDAVSDIFGEDNLQIYDGPRALEARKAVAKALDPSALACVSRAVTQSAKAHIERDWKPNESNKPIHCQHVMLGFAMEVAAKVLLGDASGELCTKDIDSDRLAHSYHEIMSLSFDQMSRPLNELEKDAFKEGMRYVHETLDTLISKRDKELKDRSDNEGSSLRKDFLTLLLQREDFPMEKKIMLMKIYLVAAYHTSIVGVSWTLFQLSQHEHIQSKVQEEIDAVLKDSDPTPESIKKLEYLQAVVKESMRIIPPGPFAARLVEKDITITAEDGASYTIPKDSTLLVPISVIQVSEKYWDNPLKFDPERFMVKGHPGSHPLAFMPFGFGSRVCPGRLMAEMEMVTLLVLILRQYTVELAVPPETIIQEEKLVTWAKDDIPLRLIPRDK